MRNAQIPLENTAALQPGPVLLDSSSMQSGSALEKQEERRNLVWLVLQMAAVFFLAAVLRLYNIHTAFDIHIDEPFYLGVSQSVANHLSLAYDGAPFYLHPPAFFFLEGAILKLVHPSGGVIAVIYALRPINAILGAMTVAYLLLIGRSLAGTWGGLAAGLGCAIDPFVVHMNSINLLDTSAIFWVTAGYAVLLPGLVEDPKSVSRGRIIQAGIFFGLGVLTKDMMAALTVLPLLICMIMGWSLPRRMAFVISAITGAMYLLYLAGVILAGQWHEFSKQKLAGLYRFLGLVHITGFHRKGGPSLLQSVLGNLDQYLTTYAWIALGVPALVLLFYYGGRNRRLLTVWTACAYALLGYGMAHGTLEEQFFYFLVVPVILAVTVAIKVVFELDTNRLPLRQLARTAGPLLALVFVGWSGYVWQQVHFVPDNDWEHLNAYVHQNLPRGVSLGVTAWTGVPILIDYANIQNLDSIAPLQHGQVQYLQINTHQIEGHFGGVTPEQYTWLQHHAKLVYAFKGRSSGTIALYTLRR